MKAYDWFLGVVVAGAVFYLLMPIAVMMLLMTVIDIPLAIFVMACPTAALVLVPARLGQALLKGWRPKGNAALQFLVPIGVVLGLLTGVAQMSRANLAAHVDALVAGDLNRLKLPLPQGVVALRSSFAEASCDDLCLRLLLGGSATKVLIQGVRDADAPPDPRSDVTAYWIEPRVVCPSPPIRAHGTEMQLDAEAARDRNGPPPQTARVLMLARISQGDCLIEAKETLGGAEVVVSSVNLPDRTVKATRLSVYRREGAGFTEVYRLTSVRARQMWPIALLVPATDSAFIYGLELGKSPLRRNTPDRFAEGPDWPKFLTDTLGLTLILPGRYDAAPLRASIRAELDHPSPLTDAEQNLIKKYLGGFGPQPGRTPEDHALFLELVQDRRVWLTYQSTNIVPPAEAVDAAYMDALARAAWDRVRLMPDLNGNRDTAGAILARLPSETLQPFWDDMLRVSEFREFRFRVPNLLERFADFGDRGAEHLVFLIVDSHLKPGENDDNRPELVRNAALIGLCKMGPAAASQHTAIAALVTDGTLSLANQRQGKLTLRMLIHTGFSLDQIRAFPQDPARPFSEDQLQAERARASDDRACIF